MEEVEDEGRNQESRRDGERGKWWVLFFILIFSPKISSGEILNKEKSLRAFGENFLIHHAGPWRIQYRNITPTHIFGGRFKADVNLGEISECVLKRCKKDNGYILMGGEKIIIKEVLPESPVELKRGREVSFDTDVVVKLTDASGNQGNAPFRFCMKEVFSIEGEDIRIENLFCPSSEEFNPLPGERELALKLPPLIWDGRDNTGNYIDEGDYNFSIRVEYLRLNEKWYGKAGCDENDLSGCKWKFIDYDEARGIIKMKAPRLWAELIYPPPGTVHVGPIDHIEIAYGMDGEGLPVLERYEWNGYVYNLYPVWILINGGDYTSFFTEEATGAVWYNITDWQQRDYLGGEGRKVIKVIISDMERGETFTFKFNWMSEETYKRVGVAVDFLKSLKDVYGFDENLSQLSIDWGHTFRYNPEFLTEQLPPLDFLYVRFNQYYEGLPVRGAWLTVLLRANEMVATGISGFYFPDIELPVTPLISKEEAERIAKNETGEEVQKSELSIYVDYSLHPPGNYRLSYRCKTTSWELWIDAIDGSVIEKIYTIVNVYGEGNVYREDPFETPTPHITYIGNIYCVPLLDPVLGNWFGYLINPSHISRAATGGADLPDTYFSATPTGSSNPSQVCPGTWYYFYEPKTTPQFNEVQGFYQVDFLLRLFKSEVGFSFENYNWIDVRVGDYVECNARASWNDEGKSILLNFYEPDRNECNFHSVRSNDIVFHEMGHGVLYEHNFFSNEIWPVINPFHEGIADFISASFDTLYNNGERVRSDTLYVSDKIIGEGYGIRGPIRDYRRDYGQDPEWGWRYNTTPFSSAPCFGQFDGGALPYCDIELRQVDGRIRIGECWIEERGGESVHDYGQALGGAFLDSLDRTLEAAYYLMGSSYIGHKTFNILFFSSLPMLLFYLGDYGDYLLILIDVILSWGYTDILHGLLTEFSEHQIAADPEIFYPGEVYTILVFKPALTTYNRWITYRSAPLLKIFSGMGLQYRVLFANGNQSLFDDPTFRNEYNWYDSGWLTAGMGRTRIYPVDTPSGSNVFPYRYDLYQMPSDVFDRFLWTNAGGKVYVRVLSTREGIIKNSSLTDSEGNVIDFYFILSGRGGGGNPGDTGPEPGAGCGGCSTGGGGIISTILIWFPIIYIYFWRKRK